MPTQAPDSAVINCNCAIAKGQAGPAEHLGSVHVRVRSEDEDCDEKQSAIRACNGSGFPIHSWSQWCVPREGFKQIQTSPWYCRYLPGASRRDGLECLVSRKDFARVERHHWYANRNGKRASYAAAWIDGAHVHMRKYLCPGRAQVNHRNGNGLDNRRENLRGVGTAD